MDDKVFEYATNQLFGTQFEAFYMIRKGQTYNWPGGLAGVVCRALLRWKLRSLCRLVFYFILGWF